MDLEKYNDLEKYMINYLYNKIINTNILYNLSHNKTISVDAIITICNNCNEDYLRFICLNPNLTLDDIEKYYTIENYSIFKKNILDTIEKYYNIFTDSRIIIIDNEILYINKILYNNEILYNNDKLSWFNITKWNKHMTYEIYKLYNPREIDNNFYICCNPNGDFNNYDFSDITNIANHINRFNGIYNEKLEDTIIKYKSLLIKKIDNALVYLNYNFIKENYILFNNIYIICHNKTLTIDNIMSNTILKRNMRFIFINANITIEEIIANNLHNHIHFCYYAQNNNCTIEDVETFKNYVNDINKIINNYLSLNEHYIDKYDMNNDIYQFKFID